MNDIRNRIITISGEPVSGKSTVVKAIKHKYEEMGYTVHIISVGNTFRELAKKEYLKMYPEKKDANIADIQTDKAFIEKRNLIDGMVDSEVARRGQEINNVSRPNDVYIIDSRLAWNNIPASYAVRLTVNEAIAGTRVFNDNTRGTEDSYSTLEQAIEKTRERKKAEIARYKKRYNVDLTDEKNYDLVVNTSYSRTDELADIIIKGEERYRNGEEYPKTWKSPALFLPSQKIGETISTSLKGFSLEDVASLIRKNDYDYTKGIIEAVQKENIDVIKDGHHRCIAALLSGKTLVPYEITDKDNKFAETYIQGEVKLSDIYDWEECIRYYAQKGNISSLSDFRINDIIPIRKIQEISGIPVNNSYEQR